MSLGRFRHLLEMTFGSFLALDHGTVTEDVLSMFKVQSTLVL